MRTEAEIEENERETQTFLNLLNRPGRVASPSRRTPRISWHANVADLLERQLQDDNHLTWGFVIYRTTYENDKDWAEFLKRLRFRMQKDFDYLKGRDILDTAAVREHFRQWCTTAPQSEQQQQDGDTDSEVGPGLSPRYRYAIQVDAASLHSIVYDAPAPPDPDPTKLRWVKLINASWQPVLTESIRDFFEPIEGVVQKDVGWMKVPYQFVMEDRYTESRDRNWWVTSYCRPPVVMGYPYGL